ncbi:hypothetical protein HZF08_02430 [Paenibacillus sp. CGMCC 1.16610]|uniref:Uncharacterized protein n=1 Tax=Paenibacillus anseongense TaxID=2682845 RepID=A0ABW9UAC5_9BACL|nr:MULTISPECIES: hypothetical protein [Paenibacillus]MBA2937153.1 hypothetical protein [Paenibacillus sp. CGMCC 1.16610]MVQ36215.1 hypothetical protein [Paenibacillus anseongense]
MNIEKFLASQDSNYLFVDGPSGTGKTFFIYKFVREYKELFGSISSLIDIIALRMSIKCFVSSLVYSAGLNSKLKQ